MNKGQAKMVLALLWSNTKFLKIRFTVKLKQKKDSNGEKKQRMTWCWKTSPAVHRNTDI